MIFYCFLNVLTVLVSFMQGTWKWGHMNKHFCYQLVVSGTQELWTWECLFECSTVTTASNDNRFQKPPWPTPDSRLHPDRSWADHSRALCSPHYCLESTPAWCPLVWSWGSSCGWISHRKQVGGGWNHKSDRRDSSGPLLHSQLWETQDIQPKELRGDWVPQSLNSLIIYEGFNVYSGAYQHQLWCNWVNWGEVPLTDSSHVWSLKLLKSARGVNCSFRSRKNHSEKQLWTCELKTVSEHKHKPNWHSDADRCGGLMGTQANYSDFVHEIIEITHISKLHFKIN